MRELKFKLKDPTLTSDVNQTLSNLLSQVNKTNKTVGGVNQRVVVNTRAITQLQNPGTTPVGVAPGTPVVVTEFNPVTNKTNDYTSIANSAFQQFTQDMIVSFPKQWTVSFYVKTGTLAVTSMTLARTNPGSQAVIDFTTITFGGSPSLNVASDTLVKSDVIAMPIDSQHDYWFLIYGYNGSHYTLSALASGGKSYGGYMGGGVADLTRTNPIQNPASPSGTLSQWIVSWQAA